MLSMLTDLIVPCCVEQQGDAEEDATPRSVVTSPRIPAGTWGLDAAPESAEGNTADKESFEEVCKSKRTNSKREDSVSQASPGATVAKLGRVVEVPRRAPANKSALSSGSSAASRPPGRVIEVPRQAASASRGIINKLRAQDRPRR